MRFQPKKTVALTINWKSRFKFKRENFENEQVDSVEIFLNVVDNVIYILQDDVICLKCCITSLMNGPNAKSIGLCLEIYWTLFFCKNFKTWKTITLLTIRPSISLLLITQTHTLSLFLSHTHTHTQYLSLSLSLTHTNSLSQTHTHTHKVSHTYAHAHTQRLSLSYTHAHTHALSLSFPTPSTPDPHFRLIPFFLLWFLVSWVRLSLSLILASKSTNDGF